MLRALFALLVVSLAFASLLVSGASAGRQASVVGGQTEATAKIVLRGRQSSQGPWRRYLWMKLDNVKIVISFSVCAVWNQTSPSPTCRVPRGNQLPEGTTMRLEQRRANGTGWRTVGTSRDAALQAVLSNTVSGNRVGSVSYRVTLRNESGRVRGTSNTFKVFWSK